MVLEHLLTCVFFLQIENLESYRSKYFFNEAYKRLQTTLCLNIISTISVFHLCSVIYDEIRQDKPLILIS